MNNAQNTNAPKQNEYLLLFRGSAWWKKLSAEELQESMGQFRAWMDGIKERGILKGAQPLAREGKLVSGKHGRIVADGPFAESKEAIGGYFLLQVETIEEAIAIAQACPSLEHGTQVEVRPVAEECPMAEAARELAPEGQLATA
ncbi:MAG: hypothetical protein C5B50_13980 [Verrucomicrobia bacterium]|nr:MAG: hypothetical protein C5B50_13980 [Verrucomicrobiota bacterium]